MTEGNIRYREIVYPYKLEHIWEPSKFRKTKIKNDCIDKLLLTSGLVFVKYNEKDDSFIRLSRQEITTKVAQALREKAPELRATLEKCEAPSEEEEEEEDQQEEYVEIPQAAAEVAVEEGTFLVEQAHNDTAVTEEEEEVSNQSARFVQTEDILFGLFESFVSSSVDQTILGRASVTDVDNDCSLETSSTQEEGSEDEKYVNEVSQQIEIADAPLGPHNSTPRNDFSPLLENEDPFAPLPIGNRHPSFSSMEFDAFVRDALGEFQMDGEDRIPVEPPPSLPDYESIALSSLIDAGQV